MPREAPGVRARALRILHAPTDVGGNAIGLSRAERALGARSTVAVFARSSRGYEADIDLNLGRAPRVVRLARRVLFAAAAAPRYDVFHFNFGQTLLPTIGSLGVDLPLLRAFGKRIFVTFQGCDARLTSHCRDHFAISCCGRSSGPGLCSLADDRRKRDSVAYALRHAHGAFAVNPDLLHVIPGATFIPYAAVNPASFESAPPDSGGGPLRVAHAPTSRLIKGTDHVLAAKAALDARNDIEWMLIENQPHREALEAYRRADIAIDQLRVGWYGGFAVEMMALGKPVIAYIREDDLRFIPAAMARELPIIRATPDTLIEVLREVLNDRARLREIGERSRRYVERWHDPLKIARRMLAIYEDPTRKFWDNFDG